MRTWKPGDPALVKRSDGEWRLASYAWKTWLPGRACWRFSDGSIRDFDTSEARPIIVIDPEDREQVDRLTDAYEDDRPSSTDLYDHMQDALRSLVADPRPEEPLGLGAVVEDEKGVKWLRHDSTTVHQRWLNTDDCDVRYRTYDQIDATRVLSAGWSE